MQPGHGLGAWSLFWGTAFGVCGYGEERRGEHGQGHACLNEALVAGATWQRSRPDWILACWKRLFHAPAGPGDVNQLGDRHGRAEVADAAGQLAGLGDRAADQEGRVLTGAGVQQQPELYRSRSPSLLLPHDNRCQPFFVLEAESSSARRGPGRGGGTGHRRTRPSRS